MRFSRHLAAAAVLGAALALLPTAPAGAAASSFTQRTGGPLDYWTYQPSSYDGASAVPLVVYLHGCNQTAPDVAVGTRWNEKAEAEGFLAVYPQQLPGLSGPVTTGNANGCWNFYDPTNADRGMGEARYIAEITRQVMNEFNVDPSRVFLSGASGGGGMTSVMAATYPDLYAAVGVIAGCPYFACTDATGALAYGTMLRHGVARPVPTFVADGTIDQVTPYPLTEAVVQEWLGVGDLADDGLANLSVGREPVAVENHGFDTPPQPLSGDPCLVLDERPNRLPCAGGVIGFQGTYPYTVRHYDDASGDPFVELWTIHGAGHAYPGGNPEGSFVDPLGPDITTAAWNFFAAHPMS